MVARGTDALTILDNSATRNIFVNELLEVSDICTWQSNRKMHGVLVVQVVLVLYLALGD